MNCKTIIKANDLNEVSRICKNAVFCKSKIQSDKTFLVESFNNDSNCPDPRNVWMFGNVEKSNKIQTLDTLLEMSGFHEIIAEKCNGKEKCNIYIKTNFAPTTQKEFEGYTDPELVEHVADVLEKKGHAVSIFETETKLADFSPVFYPETLAKRLNPPYRRNIINLTPKERIKVQWNGGVLDISKPLSEADAIISMGKIKSLSEFYLSVALKNMYGALPDRDKYHQFHWQESGFDVENATVVSNHSTPVDFSIMDGIVTEDGGKTSSMHLEIEKEHFNAGILMASRDPLAIDKLVSMKIGFDQNKPSVTRRESEFRGDFDLGKIPDSIKYFNIINTDKGIMPIPITSKERKFEIFKDMKNGKLWEKPTEFGHVALNTFQFILPRTFGVPDRIMKVAMCAVSPNYTVMNDEEKARACKIENMLPPRLTSDWT